MENIFAKGGKTKVKYDYIPQKAIDELSYTIDKVTKGISGDKLLSGVYVKSDAKSKTKSGSNLTAKILAMTDDEDKKEVILEKDVKEFQKYISDKLITAFYLGLPLAYDFKGDYSYGGGVITMVVDDAKRKTTQAIKNAKNKKFELGLKYPQYDFEKLLGKPIIKDVFGKTMTFNDGTTEKYQYRLWIWKDCVIGQTIGSENSSRGFKDFTYGEKPTLMGGYKSVQTSKESKLESIINFMAKDKDGFVKDNNVLYNGLGGANFETLETNKIKYAKGGMTTRSKHSLMQDRRRVSSEPWEVAYQKRKSKMEAGGTLPTPFGQAGLVGETGAMNEMELFAMGGGLPQGVHQYYANTYNPAYPTPHGYAKGGEVEGGAFDLSIREKSAMYKYLDKGDFTEEKFMKMFDKNEPQTADIIYYWAESRGLNTPQSRRLHKSSMKQMGYAKGGEVDYRGYVTNDVVEDIIKANGLNVQIEENWLNGYEIFAKKIELEKVKSLLNQYNIKSEFVQTQGFGLNKLRVPSQVIHYAKGGMTDVERQSMIDMGYTQEQIKEVEDNPRRGGRFAKGGGVDRYTNKQGFTSKGGKIIVYYWIDEDASELGESESFETEKEAILEAKKVFNDGDYPYIEIIAPSGYLIKSFGSTYEKGGKIGFDGLAKKVAKKYEGKPVKEKFQSEYGKTYSKAEAMEVGKKVAGKVYRQQQSMAKGGEIQMSEIYNVNGKDYLFHTPLQNDKGTYTGWDAYEVVYDIKDGEKHLNYTKTKKGKSKYFPNGVKRTEAEDSFAKGGEIESYDEFIAREDEYLDNAFNRGSDEYKIHNKVQQLMKKDNKWHPDYRGYVDETYYEYYKKAKGFAKGGEIQEKRERIAEYIATHEDLDNYGEIDEDWYDWEFDKKLKWVNKNILTDDKEVKYYFDEYLYAKGGKVKTYNNYYKTDKTIDGVPYTKQGEYAFKEIANISKASDWSRSKTKIVKEGDKYVLYVHHKGFAKGGKTQGYNDKLDESLGNTKGKRSTKEQNYKDRRNESEAMEKKGGKRKYSSVKTMDKGSRSKRKTPLTLAKEIRKEGEKWQDAVKRASAILKKKAK